MFKEELIIIRHGRSQHNVQGSTDLDSALTDFGHRQAENVARFVNDQMSVGDVFTSPFLRCLQTVEPLADLGNPVVVLPALREYLNHCGQEVHIPSRKELFSFIWSLYPDRGETYRDEFNETFLRRMYDAYDMLADRSLVVTHGLPALTLLKIATENTRSVPIWDHSIDNCSITVIRRGRLIWHGRNLYHELEYDPRHYYKDLHGVLRQPSDTFERKLVEQ